MQHMIVNINNFTSATQKASDGFTIFKGVVVNAISSIANSIKNDLTAGIDSAFARIDTMEQFNRTMTALTGSSNLAAEALENIRQTVTGTAYGLDVAAQSVQGLVTSGVNINTATSQVAALADAVSFYGKGTNESLSSVSEAWSKIATSGKVSATDIRSLTLAGIPVYKIYADAVGKSVGSVQSDLSAGTISAAEFQRTLTAALMDGTEHFASIEGAALAAGASWKGTFDNMGAAIARGWTKIITSIDESLAAAGFPTMREIIKNVGVAMENFLGIIADNIDIIVGFGTGIIVAATAWGIYTAATWLAKTANQELVISLLTNPFLWIAIIIGVVVAAIYRWIQSVGGLEIAWDIVVDKVMLGWDILKIGFFAGVYYVQNLMDKMGLGISKAGAAIAGFFGDMKVNVLTILENMVNGAIDVINKLINTVNNIPGVSIDAIEHVTFAATAAAENEAAKQARMAGITAQESDIAARTAEREASLKQMAQQASAATAMRQAGIATKQAAKAMESAAETEGMSLDDLTEGTAGGKALKTAEQNKLITDEDLKMLADIAAYDVRLQYQQLTPEISMTFGDIRETADVDGVIERFVSTLQEQANSRLAVVG